MPTRYLWPFVLLAMLLLLPAVSQQGALADVVTGKGPALTVQLKEMGPEWRQFSLDGGGPTQTANQLPGAISTMVLTALSLPEQLGTETYYTKGELFTANGETYIVAYTLPRPALNSERLLQGDSRFAIPVELTLETPLTLSLLNLRQISHLTGIQPVEVAKLLEPRQPEARHMTARDRARQTQSQTNLRQLAVAALIYAQDNDEVLPTADGVFNQLGVDPALLIQPGTNTRYAYNAAVSGLSLGRIDNPTTVVMFYETMPWPDGSHIAAFVDGHVQMISAEEWPAIEQQLR